jgi:hypothetical protein
MFCLDGVLLKAAANDPYQIMVEDVARLMRLFIAELF